MSLPAGNRKESIVIVLNGTSSSGKSTLSKELQNRLSPPFLHFGIDSFGNMLPANTSDYDLKPNHFRSDLRGITPHIISGYHRTIRAIAETGLNVIADHIMRDIHWKQDLKDVLQNNQSFWVGTHCPLKICEAREKWRGDRIIGMARSQFNDVHSGMTYDLEVNTGSFLKIKEASNLIAIALKEKGWL